MNEIKESVVDTFIGIKKELDSHYIFKQKRKFTDYLLRAIYKRWGQAIINDKLDYNVIAFSFNKVYFWKNLLKSIVFFDIYYDLIGDSIIDVGCGAAPVSIAIASLTKNKKRENISIFLIDKSKKQLSIARDFTQIMSIEIESFTEAFFDIKHEYSELVIFSYFFCEQKNDFLKKLFNNREKFSRGFIVIDHKNNIKKLEEYFKNNGADNIESISVNCSIPEILIEYIYDEEVNVYGCFYRP